MTKAYGIKAYGGGKTFSLLHGQEYMGFINTDASVYIKSTLHNKSHWSVGLKRIGVHIIEAALILDYNIDTIKIGFNDTLRNKRRSITYSTQTSKLLERGGIFSIAPNAPYLLMSLDLWDVKYGKPRDKA